MPYALITALSLLAANPPLPPGTPAPPGTPETRYCLRVDPTLDSRIETIQCRTRDDWATLGIDVDREWAQNGVRIIGPVTS
jgi:hypothetical protein